jgi:hypothetical protein
LSKINSILNILQDGKYRQIEDIRIEINAGNFEMQKILTFLNKFEFIEIYKNEKIKTKQSFRRIISQEIT